MGFFSKKKEISKKPQQKADSTTFLINNMQEKNKYYDKIDECYSLALGTTEFELRVALFKKVLDLYDEYKAFCESKPGGHEYFMEHEWVLKNHIEDYNHALDVLNNIVPKIKELSKGDGIKQKDIYQHFSIDQKEMKKILDELERTKCITREKSGNTYLIKFERE